MFALTSGPAMLTRLVAALSLVAGALIVTAPEATEDAGAQPDLHSDWMPFVGEQQLGCTLQNGRGPCASHHPYWAMDVNMPHNEPVYAAGPGEVRLIEGGCAPLGGDGPCNSRAGNYVAVDHGDHLSRYIHLASFAAGLEVGDDVVGGQLIGYVGNSGTSGEGLTHLHYDEISHPVSTTTHVPFGPMLACHGTTVVQYPDILGTTDWQDLDWGTTLRNDGYECLGGATVSSPPPPPTPTFDTRPGGAIGLAFGDFDNDGRADLVIGAPGEDVGRRADAGTSAVVEGAASGLGNRTTLRSKRGLKGAAEAGDMLGAASTTGDFDCDGDDDVAIGIPGEDIRGITDAGAVTVAYATSSGFSNSRIFYQGKWMADEAEPGDHAGAALASGDFDGDGCDDLAVGAPGEDVTGAANAGAVTVIFGGPGGFGKGSRNSPLLRQGSRLEGFAEAGDHLGATLAAGDFNCDGIDDLAIGVPSEGIDASDRAGAVTIAYSARSGFNASSVTIYQSSGLEGILESGDRVGASLAAGDFDNDGCDDLAAGAPSEDIDAARDAGAVSVAFGSRRGLRGGRVLYQGGSGRLPGRVESGDILGAALTAGDINCDGIDDLAIGAPGESIRGRTNTGWVGVTYGAASPFASSTRLHQGTPGIPGKNEPGDLTGTALAAGDFNGDGCDDLAIGAPGEAIGSKAAAGRALLVRGSRSGPAAGRTLSQAKNLPGASEAGDHLGGPGVWQLLGLSLH